MTRGRNIKESLPTERKKKHNIHTNISSMFYIGPLNMEPVLASWKDGWFSVESANDRPLRILKGKGSPYVKNTITTMWNIFLLGLVLRHCTEMLKISILVKYGKWQLIRTIRLLHEFHITWNTVCPLRCKAEEKFHRTRKGCTYYFILWPILFIILENYTQTAL